MVTEQAVRSTVPVVQAGRDLRDALDDPDRAAKAADQLAAAAEASIARLEQLGAGVAPGLALVPDDAETMLAATLSQLGVAGMMFAASEAVGEHGPAEPAAMDEPLRRMDATVTLLTAPAAPTVAALPPSTTVAEAVRGLERQLGRTVDDVITRSTKVISSSVTGIHDRGPDEVRKAWDMLNQKFHLREFGGKLVQLALRAFRSALAMLARIVPATWLAGIRASVDRLLASVDQRGPGKAVVGAAIGADRLAELAKLDQSTLDMAKLDRGTGDLAELNAKYGKLMDLCGGIGTAIGLAAKFTGVLKLAIPQLGVIILAAHVLVIGSVIVLGRDHVDAGVDAHEPGRGLVRGVRTIVTEATA